MKKFFLMATLIVCLTGIHKNVSAQYYFFDDEYYDSPFLFEAGISMNAMNCLTDMGGTRGIGRKFVKDLNIGYTQASGGVFFNVAYKNAVALRLEGTFGKIAANDKVLKDIPVTDIASERYNRNLNFRSYITEVALLLEIHPKYIFIDWPMRENPPPRTSPYLLAGVGYFSFNPQTKLGNRYVDLQPLRTEGQGFAEYGRKEYKLNQLNIPLGAGLKYELSPLVNLRGECLYRVTFTDYLDDLSTTYIDPALFGKYLNPQQEANARLLYDRQILNHAGIDGIRGKVKNKDGYFSFNLKISVVIGRERMRR